MKREFYSRLEKVIRECEANPMGSTMPLDGGDGWEYRVSKANLGTWSERDYDILLNGNDNKTLEICDDSTLNCFVYCDRGGYMYLVFE